MKKLVLVVLLAVSLSSPAFAVVRPAPARSSRIAVSWIVRVWRGIIDTVGGIRLFDGDGGLHTLPPPSTATPIVSGR